MANHFTNRTTDGTSTPEDVASDADKTIHITGPFGKAKVFAKVAHSEGETPNIFEVFFRPAPPVLFRGGGSLFFEIIDADDQTNISIDVV